MKTYPSIPKDIVRGQSIYAFDKLDGSNIRAEWSRKRGFYKFGTRNRLVDETDPIFGQAIPLVLDKYGDVLSRISRDQKWQRALFFFEFFGPSSFAGNHVETEPFDVVLIDVAPYKKGFLSPKDFLKLFGMVEIAELLYHGPADQEFVESVRGFDLEGVTFEGVVCKGAKTKQGHGMFKVKTEAWLDALKDFCEEDAELFKRLS